MKLNFSKTLLTFFSIVFLLCFNTTLNAQDEPIEFNKEVLMDLLYKHTFQNFYIDPNIPPKFQEKRKWTYGIPDDEIIVAFVDASGSGKGKVKNGIAIGLKGLYINNASSSYAPGTQFISYLKLKAHELWTIKSQGSDNLREFKVEFTAMEISGLSKAEKEEFQEILMEIKNKA